MGCLDRRGCAHLSLNFLLGNLKTVKHHNESSYCSFHSLSFLSLSFLSGSSARALRGGRVGTQGGGGRGCVLRPGPQVGQEGGGQAASPTRAGSSPVGHPAAPRPRGARRKMACRAQLLACGLVLLSFSTVSTQRKGPVALRPRKERGAVASSSVRTGRGSRVSLVHFGASCRKAGWVPAGGDCRQLAFQEGGDTGSSQPPGLWPQKTEDTNGDPVRLSAQHTR